ncbi:MAG: ATP-binding cassette domain-containing protein [Clostridia bacterium]|nr:MAG: ATP-binding cassette domain-containing protein [Clostridia bacterium]
MLKLDGLWKYFNRNTINEMVALRNLSLEIGPGEAVMVVGSNGAGKSTLLNVIAGVFPPDQGSITLAGTDITSRREYRRAAFVARVFQDPLAGTAASMTLEENLVLALRRGESRRLRRAIRAREREFFQERLASLGLGLENRLIEKVGLLSGGQRQAVALLMATLKEPRVLLLDEPTAALDPKTASLVTSLIQRIITGQRLTTLMVTHDLKQALELGSRIVMMDAGQIVMDVAGEEMAAMDVDDLLLLFEKGSGRRLTTDRVVLAQ